jgi:hypothetical protein
MRQPWISDDAALRERLGNPAQVADDVPEAALPPYALSFLAHLRLLVGVPFENLIPDPRMLPLESIRFFHLDRSWTDRLVDGVLAVGKIGSREQAHHESASAAVTSALDDAESTVRAQQRGLPTDGGGSGAPDISGFLLRSALVAGWPQMEVRAYRDSTRLTTLRLERLAPAVLIALFAGVADRVELEEPHHGIQFGVTRPEDSDTLVAMQRKADGSDLPDDPFPIALRAANPGLRVVDLDALRTLISARVILDNAPLPMPDGSAPMAIELLQEPWRQVFSDEGEASGPAPVQIAVNPATPAETSEPGARS